MYNSPLINSGLNYAGPLTGAFFSIVNTTVLHDPWLVESVDMKPGTEEPQIQRNHITAHNRGRTISYMQLDYREG